jgi:hypothetical protein
MARLPEDLPERTRIRRGRLGRGGAAFSRGSPTSRPTLRKAKPRQPYGRKSPGDTAIIRAGCSDPFVSFGSVQENLAKKI